MMSDRPSFVDHAESHLQEALESDDSEIKDNHIRSALQACVFDKAGVAAGHSESD
jgi:hypothetical protein